MTDDPLFDPWGSSIGAYSPSDDVEEGGPTPLEESTPDPTAVGRWRRARLGPLARHTLGPSHTPQREPDPAGAQSPLQRLVLPLLFTLAQRLELARHETVIDDRTAQATPAIRFRLNPWAGPFDTDSEPMLPALEFVADGDGGIIVRRWDNPAGRAPDYEEHVQPEGLEPRLSEIILEYVSDALHA